MSDLLNAPVSNERLDFFINALSDKTLVGSMARELKALRQQADHFRDATEQVCEWERLTQEPDSSWKSSCRILRQRPPRVFCEDCGGKVVVKSGA